MIYPCTRVKARQSCDGAGSESSLARQLTCGGEASVVARYVSEQAELRGGAREPGQTKVAEGVV